jgi:DNA polymerase I
MKKMYLDIETDDAKSIRSYENEIFSISTFVDDTFVTFTLGENRDYGLFPTVDGKSCPWIICSFVDEKVMLERFIDFLCEKDPDILIGWNISAFDIPYVVGRCEKLGVNVDRISPVNILTVWELGKEKGGLPWYMNWGIKLVGRIVFDLMAYYRLFHVSGVRSLSLDGICKDELGVGKLCYERAARLYRENYDRFLFYNVRDVDLIRALDLKCGISDFALTLSRMTGAELDDLFFKSQIVDTYILYHSPFVLPTKSRKEREKPFSGAVVLRPAVTGVIQNVALYDVERMYPSIILAGNMSPETLVRVGEQADNVIEFGNGVKFRKEPEGFIPSILKQLFTIRKKIEERLKGIEVGSDEYVILMRQRQVVKDTINSMYGVLAFPGFRLFEPKIAETITYVGRMILTHLIEYAAGKYKVIYGDTDSLFVQINSVEEAKEFEKELNDEMRRFCREKGMLFEYFNIDFEKFYSSLFIKNKKRYAGKLVWKGDFLSSPVIEVVGFEYKRSDTSRYFAQKQIEIFEKVLDGKKQEVDFLVTGMISDIMSGRINLFDVAKPISIGTELASYKANVPQLRAVEWSNRYLGTTYGLGSKVYLVPVKYVVGLPPTDVIAIDEECQLPKMTVNWEKIALDCWRKVKQIYDVLGWQIPEFEGKSLQTKLTGWLEEVSV